MFRTNDRRGGTWQVMGAQRGALERLHLNRRVAHLQSLDSLGRLVALMGHHARAFIRDLARVRNSHWLRVVFLYLTGLAPTNNRLFPAWSPQRAGGKGEGVTDCFRCASGSQDSSAHIMECPADRLGRPDGSRPVDGATRVLRRISLTKRPLPLLAEDRCRLHMLDLLLPLSAGC